MGLGVDGQPRATMWSTQALTALGGPKLYNADRAAPCGLLDLVDQFDAERSDASCAGCACCAVTIRASPVAASKCGSGWCRDRGRSQFAGMGAPHRSAPRASVDDSPNSLGPRESICSRM